MPEAAGAQVAGYLWVLWIGGGVGFLAGAILLAVARAADRRNYIIQRATPMPLALVNERDDVWLRGRTECDAPVVAKHFGFECVHYSYKLEERVRKTRTDSKGRTTTHQEWVTRERKSESAQFRLRDGDLTIAIDGTRAEFRDLAKRSERIGSFKHSLSFLGYPSTISAVGSVSEKCAQLEPYMNIPLMITPKTREDFVKAAERAERVMRFFGFLLLWAGAGAAFYGLSDHLAWPFETGGVFEAKTLCAALGAGTALYTVVWAIYIYNTFVTYNVRVQNAWRQIDVDLRMRYDLIPQLVESAKGFMRHEKGLLERVVRLRGEALAGGQKTKIASEGPVARTLGEMRVAVEKYPDLKSQPLVAKLMRELTAIEEKIAHGRKTYNEAVNEYNANVLAIPRGLLARLAGFRTQVFFRATAEEREAVKV